MKKSSWTETLLWLALGLFLIAFLLQLLKLWQTGTAGASNALSTVGTALQNTLAAAESFLTGLLTAPFTAIPSALSAIPDFLSLATSFLTGLAGSGNIAGNVSSFFGGLFGQGIAAVTAPPAGSAGQGSSYAPTGQLPSDTPAFPSTTTNFAYSLTGN